MKITDAFTLARTKQQSRRLRRMTVTGMCSVLFAVLLTGSFITQGLADTSVQLRHYGYNGQYLATANANYQNANMTGAQRDVQHQMDAELRARKIAVTDSLRQSDSYQKEMYRRASLLLRQRSRANSHAFQTRSKRDYHPVAVYEYEAVETMINARGTTQAVADLFLREQRVIVEQGNDALRNQPEIWGPPDVMHTSQALIQNALRSGQSFDWQPGQPYPIVVPYALLPKMEGVSLEGKSDSVRLAAYKDLATKYTGAILTYCYRNPVAQEQIITTLQYNKAARGDKDSTTNPVNISNCQTLDQAKLKKAKIIADPSDPNTPKPLFTHPDDAPITRTVQFKVVGFIPTQTSLGDKQNMLTSVIAGVNNWGSHVNPGIMPTEVYNRDSFLSSDTSSLDGGSGSDTRLFFRFASQADQQRFIASGCTGMGCMKPEAWTIDNFGNVIVTFSKIMHTTHIILIWSAIVLGAIAMLLLMSTAGKLIADSRKEIAVFRSLGAGWSDIAQVYLGYSLLLAVNIGIGAIVLSAGASLLLSLRYSATVATAFAATFGIVDKPIHASLFGVNPVWVLTILGVVALSAVCGTLLALTSANYKNVMQYMKDE